jgi:two-component system, NtrC family, response regulator HydG
METDKTNKIKVLVVDDEKVVRDFLIQLLATDTVGVEPAENGFQAIEMAKKDDFDLVFMDVRMPGMGGLETFRELKKINPGTEYVMMTGYAVDDILQAAKKEGAAYALKKPFDINQIKKIFEDCIKDKVSHRSLKILVVDDEVVVLHFFKNLLKDDIYEVVAVETGTEALKNIMAKNFDLVFLDTVLKDMEGMELYLRIQEIRPKLPIVLITGYIEKCEEIKQLNLNIRGCLYKPFEINKIYEEIDRVRHLKGL